MYIQSYSHKYVHKNKKIGKRSSDLKSKQRGSMGEFEGRTMKGKLCNYSKFSKIFKQQSDIWCSEQNTIIESKSILKLNL